MSLRCCGNNRSSGGYFHLGLLSRGRSGLGSRVLQGGDWSGFIDLRRVLIYLGGCSSLRLLGFEKLANARRQPTPNLRRSKLPAIPLFYFLLLLL